MDSEDQDTLQCILGDFSTKEVVDVLKILYRKLPDDFEVKAKDGTVKVKRKLFLIEVTTFIDCGNLCLTD